MKNGLTAESQLSGVKMVLPIPSYAQPSGSLSRVLDFLLTRSAYRLGDDDRGTGAESRGQSLTGVLSGTVSMSWTLFFLIVL